MTVFLFLVSFSLILTNIQRIIGGVCPDFSVLWLSAKDLIGGINPYLDSRAFTPNGYPPVSHLFYIPLAFLDLSHAQAIFTLISFASIVGAVYLSIKIAEKRVHWQHFLLFLSFTFLSFPLKFTLGMGQVNAIVLFLLVLSFYLADKKNFIGSGITLGISIALKPVFAFFLLFFALTKSWKVVWISLATTALAVSTSLLSWGVTPWISWLKIGIFPLSNFAGREVYYNQGIMGFVSRLFENINIRKYLSGLVSALLVIVASLFTIRKHDRNLIFSFFILTLLLVDTLSWQHHFVWLIFPFVVLGNNILRAKRAVFMVLIATTYLLASWNFKNPTIYQAFPLSLVLSNQFYATLILLGLNAYFFKTEPPRPIEVSRNIESSRF